MKYERLTMINNGFIDTNCRNCKQCKKVGRKYICNDMTACNEEIITRLAELENKIDDGTLIELPCMHKTVFGYYRVTFFSKMFNCIDSEIFFNKAEAEKKLKELKGE